MNNVTLFLYAVELAGRLPVVALLTSVVSFLLWMFCPPRGEQPFGDNHEGPFRGFYYAKPVVCIAVVFWTLAFFVPSKDTLYLMASSEVTELVVKTPEAQEIMNDVKQIIDIQLEKLKK